MFYDFKGIVWPDPLRCFPPGYPYAYSDRFSGYYSPGICPSGWTEFPTSNLPDPEETTAYCCPSGYTAWGEDIIGKSFACFTTHVAKTSNTIPALVISGSIDIAKRPYGDNTDSFITDYNFDMPWTGWNVFGVQVRYRTGDFSSQASTDLESNIQTSLASETTYDSPTITLPVVTSTSPVSAPDTSNPNSKMSNGAKIGIGLGIPLLIFIVGTIIAFILIRKRGRRRRPEALSNGYSVYRDNEEDEAGNRREVELPTNRLGIDGSQAYAGNAEIDGSELVELGIASLPAEIDISVRHAVLDDVSPDISPLSGGQPNHGASSAFS